MTDSIISMKQAIRAFEHPRRRKILDLLREGEYSVNELVDVLQLEQSMISQHLMVLRAQKLVTFRREGKFIFYSRNEKLLQTLQDCCEQFYQTQKVL